MTFAFCSNYFSVLRTNECRWEATRTTWAEWCLRWPPSATYRQPHSPSYSTIRYSSETSGMYKLYMIVGRYVYINTVYMFQFVSYLWLCKIVFVRIWLVPFSFPCPARYWQVTKNYPNHTIYTAASCILQKYCYYCNSLMQWTTCNSRYAFRLPSFFG